MTNPRSQGKPATFEAWDTVPGTVPALRPPPPGAPRQLPQSETPPKAPMTGLWSGGATSPAYGSNLDLRPILLRRDDSIWARAENARDQLYDAMVALCAREGIDALVVKSTPYVVPTLARFECWVPLSDALVTERAAVSISVLPREFHRFDLEYKIEISDRGKTKVYDHLHAIDSAVAVQIVGYLMRRCDKPNLNRYKLRTFPLQLWRPKNKVDVIGRDWATLGAMLAGILGFFTLLLQPLAGSVLLLAALGLALILRRREVLTRSSGKPDGEPRFLYLVDSWQTVIPGLGTEGALLRDRLMSKLRTDPPPHLRSRLERIWYWGLEGKEEREQLVLGLGRAMCFCHIYEYGNELYVGWDGHVNFGQWVERTVLRGRDKSTGRITQINTVQTGTQVISEYDVTDLNCLMEWTHAKFVEQVKQLMKERQIDLEIDFKINRGERQGLTDRRDGEKALNSAKHAAGNIKRQFLRTS